MKTGQIISGAAHAGLIAWAVFGGAFQSEPLPYEVTEVTAISAEEYAALTAPKPEPEAAANVDTPEPPAAGEAPTLNSRADSPPEVSRPEATESAQPDTTPDVETPAPPAQADVGDDPPVLQPPGQDTAALVPEPPERSAPSPAPRVAPEPVAPPDPDVQIDDIDRERTAPDETSEPVEEQEQPTAREEAATEIVTEAEEADAAPSRSLRPRSRPQRAAQAETQDPAEPPSEQETATSPDVDDAAVEDAVAAALGGSGDSADTPAGPPLTAGEKDALRVAVEQCWNVGSLSTEALGTTVVVSVRMAEDGSPLTGSIEMVSSSGGGDGAAEQAFQAARRAIIRCGVDGYDLPPGKYERWRDIEMTFNPERMRIK
ncbi:energy transducer TonB [Roseovarius salis]|uniref:energy transducer TonB n=1 Tax=Roseovarius salis TaxID=3376063 RepID=UPI0037C56402